MLKVAIAAAAAGAGCVSLVAPGAGADRPQITIPQRALKGDRLPIGSACSQSVRPNNESKCIRDIRPPRGQPAEVKIAKIISQHDQHVTLHVLRSKRAVREFLDGVDAGHVEADDG